MNAKKVHITPAQAAKWLDTVPAFQRKINPAQVKKIAMAITRNEWRENGATIVFNRNGELIDGQHRLAAIKESGKSVWSLVITNVSSGEATFHTIDDCKSRKVTDFLKCTNVAAVAGAMRMYWHYLNGMWPTGPHGGSAVIPTADLLKTIQEHQDYVSGLVYPVSAAGRFTGQLSFCVFLVFMYTKVHPVKDPERLAQFFARVGDGQDLSAGDPALMLRSRFLDIPRSGKINRQAAQAMILKALNLYLDHKTSPYLRFEVDREAFPSFKTNENTH